MAQLYSLFISDRPVITIHLDDELHCAEFGRIHNHDTEEQDAHPTGKQQRTAYASHPTVRARLATPNQIGSQKLSFLEDWCWSCCAAQHLTNCAPVCFPHRTLPRKFTGVDLATFMDVLQHQLCPDTLR